MFKQNVDILKYILASIRLIKFCIVCPAVLEWFYRIRIIGKCHAFCRRTILAPPPPPALLQDRKYERWCAVYTTKVPFQFSGV